MSALAGYGNDSNIYIFQTHLHRATVRLDQGLVGSWHFGAL